MAKDMDRRLGAGLGRWFSQEPGAGLLESERALLEQALPGLFGYHLVQLGKLLPAELLTASRISHKLIVQFDAAAAGTRNKADIVASDDALPLVADGIDVVLVPHMLEFSEHPHKLLREIERVLIGDGHLVLLGFNPWSMFGLWRAALAWRREAPWCGHFYGLARVKDWLSLLDFEIVEVKRFFYRPPLKNSRLLQRLGFVEKLGKYCWPYFSGAYLIVAKKRLIPLSPAKSRWRAKRRMIASGVAEPSARADHSL